MLADPDDDDPRKGHQYFHNVGMPTFELSRVNRVNFHRISTRISSLGVSVRALVIVVTACALGFSPAQTLPLQSATDGSALHESRKKISPWILDRLESGGPVEMLVVLDQPTDLSGAEGMADRVDKGRFVYETLRGRALGSQQGLVDRLRARGLKVTQLWIVNAILVRGDLALAHEIAAAPQVTRIVGNPRVKGLEDCDVHEQGAGLGPGDEETREGPACHVLDRLEKVARVRLRARTALPDLDGGGGGGSSSSLDGQPESIECGVGAVKAPDVWSQHGVRGEGIVVASMDTGVLWTHPAIQAKYRGWNGGSPDHQYSWHDAIDHTTVPFDDNNHGTHTTGTMVGDDGGSNQIGVAPGARWVACRNMEFGDGTPARYLECMQWGLAPYPEGSDPMTDGRPDLAPDITNNSWACPISEGCDALTLVEAFDNVRAAGQMTVAAVGNAGSSCSSAKEPPGIYDSAFSAGALNCAGSLESFSSRGPVTIDGSGRLKPNIAAPGRSVRSANKTGANGGYSTMSGTSMASPHVAGALALFWSAKPQFRHLIRISRCYLEQSAGPAAGSTQTCGGTGPADKPNNLWGWGMANALAAINLHMTLPESDGDGVVDACDCAPADGAAFDGPSEVSGDAFPSKETYTWASLATITGPGTVYDVARGTISQLRADGGFGAATCQSSGQATVTYSDVQTPPADDVFYYLVRARNACGTGSYGKTSGGLARTVTSCP